MNVLYVYVYLKSGNKLTIACESASFDHDELRNIVKGITIENPQPGSPSLDYLDCSQVEAITTAVKHIEEK